MEDILVEWSTDAKGRLVLQGGSTKILVPLTQQSLSKLSAKISQQLRSPRREPRESISITGTQGTTMYIGPEQAQSLLIEVQGLIRDVSAVR